MKLIKMHGTGNDFLFVDRLNPIGEVPTDRPEFVRQVCDRHFGVGADGLAFLEPHNDLDFRWDFYNSDGSEAEMCGNAARCAALLFSQMNDGQNEVSFQSAYGPIFGFVQSPEQVSVRTGEIKVLGEGLQFQSESQGLAWTFDHLDTGVPHAVVQLETDQQLQSEAHRKAASELRSHEIVGARGTNVTFFKTISDDHILAVSYERGVEDFTMACGTGVIAAAHVKAKGTNLESVRVSIPGGDLAVDFREKLPTLRGPAKRVATIELDDGFLD
ncbi:MAG: diaminopimelate epimerase [Pseudomonadota bacterium]